MRNRNYRTLWTGMLLSNIGSWMQTVVLPAYIDQRTQSAAWVGLFMFAMLGPVLLLSVVGGVLADRFPRRPWFTVMQLAQLVGAAAMAIFVARHAGLLWIFAAQLLGGIGNALNNPAMQGVLPNMVDPRDVGAVVSLNSAMVNGSRVTGPVIAAVLMGRGVSTSGVLWINAVSFLFLIAAVWMVRMPPMESATEARGWANLTHGLRLARRRSVVGRLIAGMAIFSFLSLPFVGLFAPITRLNLGLDNRTPTYKWLYATWGFGALCGALAMGTILARADKSKLIRPLLIGFAVALGVFSQLRSVAPAFPVGFLIGLTYFGMATSMLTVIQHNLRSFERARVMALWFMAFGGTVSIGNAVFGPIVDKVGARTVMAIGVINALWLSWWCDVPRRSGLVTLAMETAHSSRGDSDPVAAPSTLEQRLGDALQPGDSASLDEYGIAGGE